MRIKPDDSGRIGPRAGSGLEQSDLLRRTGRLFLVAEVPQVKGDRDLSVQLERLADHRKPKGEMLETDIELAVTIGEGFDEFQEQIRRGGLDTGGGSHGGGRTD